MQDFDYKALVLEYYDAEILEGGYKGGNTVTVDALSTRDGHSVGWFHGSSGSDSIHEHDLYYDWESYDAVEAFKDFVKSGESIAIEWDDFDVDYAVDWERWAEELELGEYSPDYEEEE